MLIADGARPKDKLSAADLVLTAFGSWLTAQGSPTALGQPSVAQPMHLRDDRCLIQLHMHWPLPIGVDTRRM